MKMLRERWRDTGETATGNEGKSERETKKENEKRKGERGQEKL